MEMPKRREEGEFWSRIETEAREIAKSSYMIDTAVAEYDQGSGTYDVLFLSDRGAHYGTLSYSFGSGEEDKAVRAASVAREQIAAVKEERRTNTAL